MSDHSELGTRGRLLDSAERLLAEKGLASTSVRMITEHAGANVAAVNYHFGSKEDLVRAVLKRRLRDIDDMRIQRLDALEVGGRKPSQEEVVRAFLEPLIVQGISRETGRLVPFVVLIRQVLSDPEAGQKIMKSWEPSTVMARTSQALARALGTETPSGPRAQLLMMLMHSAALEALYVITGAGNMPYEQTMDSDEVVESTIRYVTSGVGAFFQEQDVLEDA
ncbi:MULTISPECIES: TetR/AcrR family transcriptional regulator [Pseudovibrio]|uniref:TetR/AcrR family transcriptional regulator n=1 Tax=Stappiaceae TaxID=2821832 RepID=UPI002365934D|nr:MULTISPECIES: TetR/AcrR family transcriptional regulator [Pseudovibrio]MDD7909659.1 helix-turn-helix domain containing protein [Pseudovibrio exalbescens]MDX5592001.1 helix-turn-helix domain-containing protein [Pseudovibrio sp. SPO723]